MSRNPHILIVEDNSDDARLVEREVLKVIPDASISHAATLGEFTDTLRSVKPDVVLSDFDLGSSSGLHAIQLLKESFPSIPCIIVTGTIDEYVAVQCMNAGAKDYILKNDLMLLGPALRNAVKDRTEWIDKQEILYSLREFEEKYKNIIDFTVGGVFRTSADGKFISVNDNLVRMLGYSSTRELIEDRKGLASEHYVDPARRDDFRRLLEVSDVVRGFEYQVYRKDKTPLWLSENVRAIRDAQGRLLYYEGTVEDISGRKHSEDQLNRLASFPEMNPNPVIEIGFDGKISYLNPAARGLFPNIGRDGVSHPLFQEWDQLLAGVLGADERTFAREIRIGNSVYQQNFYFLPDNHLTRLYIFDITQQRRAETGRDSAEDRYRRVVENSIAGICIIKDEQLTFANQKMGEIFDYSPGDMIAGLSTKHLIAGEDLEKVNDTLRRLQSGEIESARFSAKALKRSGDVIAIEFHGSSTESDGKQAVIGTLLDVSDKYQAQMLQSAVYRIAEVAHAAHNLDALYPAIHSIIHEVMPADNFYIALHDAEADLITFAYFVDAVDVPGPPVRPGRGLTEFVLRTGKSLLCTEEMLEELSRRGEADLVGIPSPIWLGVPLILDDVVIGVMAVQHYSVAHAYGLREQHMLEFVSSQVAKAIDNTRARETLRESESRYRMLFEEDLTGNFVSTVDGKLLDCNPAFVKIFGFASQEEALQCNSGMLYQSTKAREEYIDVLRKEKKLENYESELRRVDGTPIHVIENVIGKFDGQGNLIQIHGYIFDNTERKLLEEQLLQSQKMEAVGQLASGIAHDFNNVMSVALTASQMIKRYTTDPQIEHYAHMIEDSTLRGASIAKQLLQFSRAESTRLAPVSLSSLIMDVKRLLEHSFPRGIVFDVELNNSKGIIYGDGGQLHQVLLNLCINARDAIADKAGPDPPHGTISFVLSGVSGSMVAKRFGAKQPADTYVAISVSDTGSGISEDVRLRMFDPFFTTKFPNKGTGLGLSIVHGIVKAHQGYIDVTTEIGKGSTFQLFLPATHQEIAEETLPKRLDRPGSGEVLLIIEDEDHLRTLASDFLVRSGYTTVTARDGEEAVEKFRSHAGKIDLVISDLGLPRLGGELVFRKLLSIDPDVKVVFSTGFVQEEKKLELLNAGARAVLQKPYMMHELLEAIQKSLR